MGKINKKQALSLLNKNNIPEYFPHWRAKGYLEAMEKVKYLEQSLINIKNNCCENEKEGEGHCHCICSSVDEVLKIWEVVK